MLAERDPRGVWQHSLELIDMLSDGTGIQFWETLKLQIILSSICPSTDLEGARPLRLCAVGKDDLMPTRLMRSLHILNATNASSFVFGKKVPGLNIPLITQGLRTILMEDISLLKAKEFQVAMKQQRDRAIWGFCSTTSREPAFAEKKTPLTQFDILSACGTDANQGDTNDMMICQSIFDVHAGAGNLVSMEMLRIRVEQSAQVDSIIGDDAGYLIRCYFTEFRKTRLPFQQDAPVPSSDHLLRLIVTLATGFAKIGVRKEVCKEDVCAAIAVLETSTVVARGAPAMPCLSLLSELTESGSQSSFDSFCDFTLQWTGYHNVRAF